MCDSPVVMQFNVITSFHLSGVDYFSHVCSEYAIKVHELLNLKMDSTEYPNNGKIFNGSVI